MKNNEKRKISSKFEEKQECTTYSCFDGSLEETVQPSVYQVWMIVNQATTLETLLTILKEDFHYSIQQAVDTSIDALNDGKVLCCVLPRDLAETKAEEINRKVCKRGDTVICLVRKNPTYVTKKT